MINRCFESFGVKDGATWREAILACDANWTRRAPMCEGGRARERYCGQHLARRRRRHGGFEKLARELVPALLERYSRPPCNELFDLIEAVGRRAFPPSGTNATQFIRDVEHSGFLAPAEDGDIYSMPFPSFAGHLLGNG